MEKLKVKHDHKLTDILKVAIFGLMLILPGLILLPSMLYYGVNEHATAPTEQVEKIEYERVDFNQKLDLPYRKATVNGITTTNDHQTINVDGVGTGNSYVDIYVGNSNDMFTEGHTYYLKSSSTNVFFVVSSPYYDSSIYTNLWTCEYPNYMYIRVKDSITYNNTNFYLSIFDLTQMFGSGNEPTIQEFNSYYPNDYYEYTESRNEILEIPTGTYETYTDITSQIQYNWNSLWKQPLFSWTNYTIVKQGIDNFTGIFGITNTSNISNLIAYELIIVAIYIVIDIVLTLFKWLTHMVGSKE